MGQGKKNTPLKRKKRKGNRKRINDATGMEEIIEKKQTSNTKRSENTGIWNQENR